MSEILARIEGRIGRLTLNRPEALNALTLGMVRDMTVALQTWQNDRAVAAVVVDGAGERGLCAGGDIRSLYDSLLAGDTEGPATFWREEYRLNSLISRYPKPYIAFMDGVVMGGGVGISAHGSHRLVTEKTMIAMPETSIGFFPDVGGTYLLSRAPGELGTHVALTSARLDAADAIVCGLADTHLPRARWPGLLEALQSCVTAAEVASTIARAATAPGHSPLAAARGWIDRCYAPDTVEAIVAALAAADTPDANKAAATIGKHSPTALKVTLAALRSARRLPTLDACLDQEYRMALPLSVAGDFAEGIRAAVVDKDRRPRWRPASLAEVGAADVERFFAPLGNRELGLAAGGATASKARA